MDRSKLTSDRCDSPPSERRPRNVWFLSTGHVSSLQMEKDREVRLFSSPSAGSTFLSSTLSLRNGLFMSHSPRGVASKFGTTEPSNFNISERQRLLRVCVDRPVLGLLRLRSELGEQLESWGTVLGVVSGDRVGGRNSSGEPVCDLLGDLRLCSGWGGELGIPPPPPMGGVSAVMLPTGGVAWRGGLVRLVRDSKERCGLGAPPRLTRNCGRTHSCDELRSRSCRTDKRAARPCGSTSKLIPDSLFSFDISA